MRPNFEDLFNKRLGVIKPGLERMHSALNKLELNQTTGSKTILVAGTNGKGGTSGFLWSLLGVGELNAGLFTSPHLCSYEERFQYTQGKVTALSVYDTWHQIRESLGVHYDSLSFFELSTLIAYKLFDRVACDWQVMEVGLGGRLDSTNAMEPTISVITSISKDHEEFLGNQLKDILKEKLGICRKGVPLFWGHAGEVVDDPESLDFFENYLIENEVPCYRWGVDFGVEGDRFFIRHQGAKNYFNLPAILEGRPDYIRRNFILACAVANYVSKVHGGQPITSLLNSFPRKDMACPNSLVGRYQRMNLAGKYVIFDVCHNPNGMGELTRALSEEQLNSSWAMISILKDKNFDDMLDMARGFFKDRIILFGIDHERGFSSEVLADRHRELPFFRTFEAAWNSLPASSIHEPLVICGSVIAVGKVFEQFEADPKEFSMESVLSNTWPNVPSSLRK